MTVEQVYNIVNTVTGEALGESIILNEDLSNLVDIGDQIQNVMGLDNYVRKLVDHIGRVVFVDRVYAGRAPSVLRDGWEYGSIMEKISAGLPEAQENETWQLQDGQSYDPNIFTAPDVNAKFFNDRITFEIPLSITEEQVKSSFSSATQMNAFVSMLHTAVANSMTVKTDQLIMRTINNAIGETFADDFSGGTYTGASGVKAVNLLYLYNTAKYGTSTGSYIDAATFINTPEAIRFAVNTFKNYIDRLAVMSTLFNIGEQARFTPRDRLHIVMLSEFKNAADTYLQSDTFNDQYTALPNAESVVFWQGSGLGYAFSDTSAINIKTASGDTVNATGVLAVMFDRDALGVANLDTHVTTNYNPKAEFFNEWTKCTMGLWNDGNENTVVFYAA